MANIVITFTFTAAAGNGFKIGCETNILDERLGQFLVAAADCALATAARHGLCGCPACVTTRKAAHDARAPLAAVVTKIGGDRRSC